MTLMERYMKSIEFYSHTDEKWNKGILGMSFEERIVSNKLRDFNIRNEMGKIEINTGLCSHDTIISRELGEKFCRVCHLELKTGVGRYNDYLVIRNKSCLSPICFNCSKKNPDKFHIKFKEALSKLSLDNQTTKNN